MGHRIVASLGALVVAVAVVSLASRPLAGQAPQNPAARAVAKAWTERTPDGQPDLQGYWTNATYTPLERPAELAGKEFFTEKEAVAYEQQRLKQFNSQAKDDIHYDNAIWQTEEYSRTANLRTSLIFDPPDGRLPPLTPEARALAAARPTARSTDSYEDRTLAERCITWGNEGPPMLPPGYYANLQILQAPANVIIRHEIVHGIRIIPLDGRPHIGPNVRQWFGDSRGRWEGHTLIVDTTNYSGKSSFRGSGPALHVVERFTRVDAETINYQFTVDDPKTWTKPWSAELPLRKFQGPIYEYACHEGNYGLANILRAARVLETAE